MAADPPDEARGHVDRIVAANARGVEGFANGDMGAAAEAYAEAVALLRPEDDGLAPALYENLGLAWLNLGRCHAAVQAFLRALDGDLISRRQSLEYLVVAAVGAGQLLTARDALAAFCGAFGPHPWWSAEAVAAMIEEAYGPPRP